MGAGNTGVAQLHTFQGSHITVWGISVTGTGVYSEEPLVLALRHAGCLDACGRSPVTGICNRESMSYTLDN